LDYTHVRSLWTWCICIGLYTCTVFM